MAVRPVCTERNYAVVIAAPERKRRRSILFMLQWWQQKDLKKFTFVQDEAGVLIAMSF
jgi:hypothetical protein